MTSRTRIGSFMAITISLVSGCEHLPRWNHSLDGGIPKIAAGEAADIQIAMGKSLESEGEFEKAKAAYMEAARRAPKNPNAELRLAVLLDRQGRFSEAEGHYEAALKASPGNAQVYCDRGYSLGLQGKNSEAEAALRQAIAKQPDMARAHNNLGILLGRTNRTGEALDEFRKAGCPEPDAHLNLAFALSQDRKWDEAKREVAMARGLGDHAPAVEETAADLTRLIAKAEGMSTNPPIDTSVMAAGSVRYTTPGSAR